MRIMTFNIRFDNPADDAYGWDYRRDMVCSVIKRYDPCIIGTQEGKWHQLVYLMDHLSGYSIHAPQRIIDESSQYPTLFYSSDQLKVLKVRIGGFQERRSFIEVAIGTVPFRG